MKRKLYVRSFVLGNYYDMFAGGKTYSNLKLVKVTEKGYNFLNEKTNKIVYTRHHFYRNTYYDKGTDTKFNLTIPIYITFYDVPLSENWMRPLKDDRTPKDLEAGNYWVKTHKDAQGVKLYYNRFKQRFSGWDRGYYKDISILEVKYIQKEIISKEYK